MPINRAAAKAAGYSDEEINAFEAEEKRKGPPQVPQTVSNEPPPPDQVTPPIPEVSSTNQWMGIIGAGAGDITGKVKDIAIPGSINSEHYIFQIRKHYEPKKNTIYDDSFVVNSVVGLNTFTFNVGITTQTKASTTGILLKNGIELVWIVLKKF